MKLKTILVAFSVLASLISTAHAANNITPPDTFFGFQLGTDRELARWDKIVEYFELLEKESDRIQVTDLGPSTEGHPYLSSRRPRTWRISTASGK